MTNPIDAAIAQAQEKAQAQVPATVTNGTVTVIPPSQGSQVPTKMNQSDFMDGALGVDGYLKVAIDGLTLPDAKNAVPTLKVTIKLSEVQYATAIRYGKNPATYDKTYDGIKAASGKSWAQARENAFRADPNASEYPSAEIPMALVDAVGNLEAGKRLGYSTPPTGRDYFTRFIREAQANGFTNDDELVVELGFEKREKGSNKWANLTFKLLLDECERTVN